MLCIFANFFLKVKVICLSCQNALPNVFGGQKKSGAANETTNKRKAVENEIEVVESKRKT